MDPQHDDRPSSLVVMVCWTVATTVLVVPLILVKRLPAAPLSKFMFVVAVVLRYVLLLTRQTAEARRQRQRDM